MSDVADNIKDRVRGVGRLVATLIGMVALFFSLLVYAFSTFNVMLVIVMTLFFISAFVITIYFIKGLIKGE